MVRVSLNSISNRLRILLALPILLTALVGVELSQSAATVQAASGVSWNGPRVYFPETGQAVGGVFLQKWAFEFRDIDLGPPVTPAVDIDGKFVQWLEYGRMEVQAEGANGASADQVVRAPIGRLYAEKMGYTRWVPAFKPIEAAGTESRYFYETRHAISNDFLKIYEQRGNEERLGAPISEEFNIGRVNYQFFEFGAMSWDSANGTRVVPLGRLDASLYGLGNVDDDFTPGDVYYSSASMMALSDAFPGERWIEIDLTNHEIIAWVGDFELMRTDAVTGPVQAPTPTGTFSIYIKHEIQNLSGIGWNGQPYSSPGTPWVMYFHLDYGIHGSTWRTTYGFGSGQGCVIPPNEAAEQLWKWADYDTKVWVHY